MNTERRDVLRTAALTLMGASAGCAGSANPEHKTMTEDNAESLFTEIVEFESPLETGRGFVSAKRFVDEEAGIVLYGIENTSQTGGGLGLTAIPISETNLGNSDE